MFRATTAAAAIVSARGGVTDRLIKVVEASLDDINKSAELLEAVASEQVEAVRVLAGDETAERVGARIRNDAESIEGEECRVRTKLPS